MSTQEITYHESYGEVSVPQLRAYKRYNVSPSDHRDLEDAFGNDHAAILSYVIAHVEGTIYRAPWPFG